MATSQAKLALATQFGLMDNGGLEVGGILTPLTISNGGSGYSTNNVLTVIYGGSVGGTLLVTAVNSGAVTAVQRIGVGQLYPAGSALNTTVSPSGGTGCTITLINVVHMLAELETVGGPAQKVATVDCTNMDSPSQYAEFIAGIIEGGEITVSGNFINAQFQQQLLTDMAAKIIRQWAACLPTAMGTFTFSGYITAFNSEEKKDKQITFTATIKVTSAVTFTP
jgi:predicted secreted protein